MKDLAIQNVIPFGDWTEREIDAAADLFGVEPEEMYELGQQPIRETEVRSADVRKNPPQQKPLIGGVNERFWAPIANAFVPINPMADASKTAATTQDLRALQKALAKVAVEVRTTLSKMTPEEWEQRERSRIEKHVKLAQSKGKQPDPQKTVVRPYSSRIKDKLEKSPYWRDVRKLINWLSDPVRKTPPFEVFTEGSSKLPFFQWSTVPGATCPGAGKCWDETPSPVQLDSEGRAFRKQQSNPNGGYCYSLSGWRHVVPYLRQLQNTVLTRVKDKSHIERALKAIVDAGEKEKKTYVVRLFVDGDFDSLATLEYWMHVCDRHPSLEFYGYSKSWDIFLEYHRKHGGVWPENYALNLSNGTLWEKLGGDIYRKKIAQMMQLPCVRGRFIAIKGVPSTMPAYTEKMAKDGIDPRTVPGHKEHMRDVVRVALENATELGIDPGSKVVSCPGKCFACVGAIGSGDPTKREAVYGKHMCGMLRLKGVNIVIAVH